jgi:hypothetical protein
VRSAVSTDAPRSRTRLRERLRRARGDKHPSSVKRKRKLTLHGRLYPAGLMIRRGRERRRMEPSISAVGDETPAQRSALIRLG